ncbi:Zn2/Cys6 DNA-binding protein [Purpureocillium lilacinum]|uniref:Zn2/Cys6 DNA-binding protein n=1 Tax=Purpureocillium lilacinum TaxID=33203 RepID=A0A179GNB7_PURLI|nr:Zn2/Cys6 DNA-binding protein [Purpureocillium lilacinum]OAQ79395.1 Zn2/Cys6 DNA-binding protein [Purpureocillium lilacinum]
MTAHNNTSGDAVEPQAKRRKVRKGTQSCWQCKHRKVRCSFTTTPSSARLATDTICDACRRRGTSCISQEFPDEAPKAAQEVGDRLGRVEALVERLTSSAGFTAGGAREEAAASTVVVSDGSNGLRNERPQPAPAVATNKFLADDDSAVKHRDVSDRLAAAWPSPREMDLIQAIPATIPTLTSTSCTPPNLEPHPPSSRDVLHLPSPGSHPVLIARKLLLLGWFLQGCPTQHLTHLGIDRRDAIMSHAMRTAHDAVTSQDHLVGSVEGVECLLIESLYHNHAGDLRRAWLAVRRAILIAQLLRLSSGVKETALDEDADTHSVIDPVFLWFRLMQMDRYLSLMLGLPPGSLDNSFATPTALATCTPLERMQRIQCVAAGRILQRDQADTHTDEQELKDTNEIDALLPARRREALSRFVSFRKSKSPLPYCRGIDFLAFIASATLCVAHIEAHRHCYNPLGDLSRRNAALQFLVHQRHADRALMELTLEIMDFMACGGADAIARKIATILRRLLGIEADAASGAAYRADSSRDGFSCEEREFDYYSDLAGGDGTTTLRVHIPHLGTIKIEQVDVCKSPALDLVLPANSAEVQSGIQAAPLDWPTALSLTNAAADDSPTFTNVDGSQMLLPEMGFDDVVLPDVAGSWILHVSDKNPELAYQLQRSA